MIMAGVTVQVEALTGIEKGKRGYSFGDQWYPERYLFILNKCSTML
jgi:hypothetical protein